MKLGRFFFFAGLFACLAFACGAVFVRRGSARAHAEPTWPFVAVVAPAGLEPSFSSVADGSAMCTGVSDEAPRVVLDKLVAAFEAAGFIVRTPAAGRVSTVLLSKGRATALAEASPVGEGGGARWLALVREARR